MNWFIGFSVSLVWCVERERKIELGVFERGVAGSDPSTRGRSPVILEVRFLEVRVRVARHLSVEILW